MGARPANSAQPDWPSLLLRKLCFWRLVQQEASLHSQTCSIGMPDNNKGASASCRKTRRACSRGCGVRLGLGFCCFSWNAHVRTIRYEACKVQTGFGFQALGSCQHNTLCRIPCMLGLTSQGTIESRRGGASKYGTLVSSTLGVITS